MARTGQADSPRIEVSISQLRHNWREMTAAAGRPVAPVLKANAYGHGLQLIGEAAPFKDAAFLAVAQADDAVSLQGRCSNAEVLCLGPVSASQAATLAARGVMICITSLERLRQWLEMPVHERPRAHLLLDTGLGRLGIPEAGVPHVLRAAREGDGQFSGLLTHPASADDGDWASVSTEIAVAAGISAELRAAGVLRGPDHFGATSCLVAHPDGLGDVVRCGIGLFGHVPEPARLHTGPAVGAALRFIAQLVGTREVSAGESIGYGGQVRLGRQGRIGVVNVGVAHGLLPQLADGGAFALGALALPVLAVYLDYTLVDLSSVDANEGDEVAVVDDDPESPAAIAKHAKAAGVIVDHVLCALAESVERRLT